MDKGTFTIRRLACAYYFACPGLAYGILTSRMPALKKAIGADDAQIGFLLLCLGLSSLVALLSSNALVARLGSRFALRLGAALMLLGACLCGLAANTAQLAIFCVMAGLGMGLTDVSMNTQGIMLEARFTMPAMSSMHAAYSLGGVCGSISGAVFAALDLGYLANAVGVLGCYYIFSFWAGARLLKDPGFRNERDESVKICRVPIFVLICGLMSMLAYAVEGSVAEWGSLFLHDDKGASEQLAALVFAVFSLAVVLCRLFADKLRGVYGDFFMLFVGAILAFIGLAVAIFAPHPVLCLGGYAAMGIGLAPMVPILFSRAGAVPNVKPREASAMVAIMSYSGLLFFPPLLGLVAQSSGLSRALLIPLAACALLAAGSLALRKDK